jgi:uncharacterized Zn-binding protein involved in type VI secretion
LPGKARVGLDNAGGGVILGPGAPTVLVNGVPAACVGDAIAPHGIGLHANAVIVQGSATVIAEGRNVSYTGALCSCGHTITPGSLDVFVGI